jgi:phytol kinase
MLPNNFVALAVTLVLSVIWLRMMDFIAQRGWVSGRLSRKIIHIGTGPLFVLCWLLFKEAPTARYLAALVPLLITVQFVLVGSGVIRDPAAVEAMSRSGDRREILRGPLYYGIAFVALTILFWRDTPTGIIALMLLCGGDGLADLVGRKLASPCLPWSPRKSWAGTAAVFLGGLILSAALVAIFGAAGYFDRPFISDLPGLAVLAFVGALVESLPIRDVDNLTVPLAAAILGYLIF